MTQENADLQVSMIALGKSARAAARLLAQATPEAKAPTKPKVPAPPPAAAKPSATVESKAQP